MSLVTGISDLTARIAAEFKASRPAGAANAIQLRAATGRLAADAAFVFDQVARCMGLGTSSPSARLHIQAAAGETRDLVQANNAEGRKHFRVTKEGHVAIGDDADATYRFVPQYPLDINAAEGIAVRAGRGSVGLGWRIFFSGDGAQLRFKRIDQAQDFFISPLSSGVMGAGSSHNFHFTSSSGFLSFLPSESGGEGTCYFGRRPSDRAATSGVHAEFWGSTMGNNGIIVTKAPGGSANLFATYRDGNTDITVTSPSAVPLTLKGAAAQTADLQRWISSSGAVLHAIASDGSIDFVSEATAPASTAAPVKWVKVLIGGTPYRLPLYA